MNPRAALPPGNSELEKIFGKLASAIDACYAQCTRGPGLCDAPRMRRCGRDAWGQHSSSGPMGEAARRQAEQPGTQQ